MNATIDTFIAPDLYNLTLPVTPPADLTLAASAFAPSFFFNRTGSGNIVGFDPRSSPYLRSLGLFCNMGDGLVNIAAFNGQNQSALKGIILRIQPFLLTNNIHGIGNVAGSDAFTVTGPSSLNATDWIIWRDDAGVYRRAQILTINHSTGAGTFTAVTGSGVGTMYAANTTLNTAYKMYSGASTNSIDIPIVQLNNLYTFAFSLVDMTQVGDAAGIALQCSVVGEMKFSTITVDPAFATKRLEFSAVAEIEHTFGTSQGL